MPRYTDLSTAELQQELETLQREYEAIKAKGLALNMARGKPSSAQLDLSRPMLGVLGEDSDLADEEGVDCGNYGGLTGIAEAKRLLAVMLNDNPENVIAVGSSSLTLMYDAISRMMMFGTGGHTPWNRLETVKWLCPSPGYDRHFAICELFGMELIPVPLTDEGPDMEVVEALVAADDAIKGIWCVPQYSNPTGITYSDEVVGRLAAMECAAPDFRIFWDNAYSVHHLSADPTEQDHVADIAAACRKAGNPDRYLKFASTSKVTFPGAGIAGLATGENNYAETVKAMGIQMVGPDKLNQLRHGRFLSNEEALSAHMAGHGALLAPKFQLVDAKLANALTDVVDCEWSHPRGGYFISFEAPEGTANKIVSLAKEAGVQLTGAGATWPYGNDPKDSNIRIAPSMPPLEELDAALDVFVTCVKLAAAQAELAARN